MTNDPKDWSRIGPGDRPTSGAAYLKDAAEALTACGSAPALYRSLLNVPTSSAPTIPDTAYKDLGTRLQVHFARNSILFSAFAAEAYVNQFLAERLARADAEAIDRLPTVEKYVVGVTYALGERVFPRGAEPVQTLKMLFEMRNELAHPKPKMPGELAQITPARAAKVLVSSARAGATLNVHRRTGDVSSHVLSTYAAEVIAWGDQWTGRLPPFDAPEPQDLIDRLLFYWVVARSSEDPEA